MVSGITSRHRHGKIGELERIFIEEGAGNADDLERIRNEGGLGLFIRSLVGLDREGACRLVAKRVLQFAIFALTILACDT